MKIILRFLSHLDDIVLWLLLPGCLIALGAFCGFRVGYYFVSLGLWYGLLLLVHWISSKIGKTVANMISKESDTNR